MLLRVESHPSTLLSGVEVFGNSHYIATHCSGGGLAEYRTVAAAAADAAPLTRER
jgi:hypothetical protein